MPALMEAALAHCRVRYGTVVLTTLIPEFYARLGFRTVTEHAFTRALVSAGASAGGRRLTETVEDVRLLTRLLGQRMPVSERLGALDTATVFESSRCSCPTAWAPASGPSRGMQPGRAPSATARSRASWRAGRSAPAPTPSCCRRRHERDQAYCWLRISATRAGLSRPSTSTVISEVTRTPPWISSTVLMR